MKRSALADIKINGCKEDVHFSIFLKRPSYQQKNRPAYQDTHKAPEENYI
jgi:hypothetical protein